ncbi:hypothetical protein [Planomonospora venezuelensis]|uniref:Putative lipoprotein with Yx(FWY)xxD motif n=1 Tax=Planomonospora venezuelensis TaxID=1999 RepID=A0A841CZ20_PLAVE|nr:hypothetical protein [Planomonospora venezuelensis]MBB5961544.1 putative lipoprotein with Yx(FWY)xxD motif [Planomonospora venezuelensis]GIM98689.1 hypothetical protein Pve01_03480 [Planomonospora venezuelensis]
MTTRRVPWPAGVVVTLAASAAASAVLSGCAGAGAPGQESSSGRAYATSEAVNEHAGHAFLKVSDIGLVVDGQGRTLYRFDEDRPSAPSCDGRCAAEWPPVTTATDVMVEGIDRSLVGTAERADGTMQVTLGGWPLYRFSGDEIPGDLKGHGAGGTWFASAPDGKKAQTPDGATAPAPDGY